MSQKKPIEPLFIQQSLCMVCSIVGKAHGKYKQKRD